MQQAARQIYLDHNATTPIDSAVVRVMRPFETSAYGNPGSFHSKGKEAKDAIDASRQWIAQWMGAREDEILFTGSGTESDNLAILGYARPIRITVVILSRRRLNTTRCSSPCSFGAQGRV